MGKEKTKQIQSRYRVTYGERRGKSGLKKGKKQSEFNLEICPKPSKALRPLRAAEKIDSDLV